MKELAIDRWIPEKDSQKDEEQNKEKSPKNHKTLKAPVKSKTPVANGKGESKEGVFDFIKSLLEFYSTLFKLLQNQTSIALSSFIKISLYNATMLKFSDEVDDIPIGKLYTPLPKRPRKAAAASTSNHGHRITAAEEVDEEQSIGLVSITLADTDLLDCPICYEPLCSAVYQCENGHIACGSCCTTILRNNCANCCLPIKNIRCRAVEKIIESVIVTCQYKSYGCSEMFSYNKKLTHEKSCNYVPCSCPCVGCNVVGLPKRLYDHFALTHKDSSRQFSFNSLIYISMDSTENHIILREKKGGELFVLNRDKDIFGSFYNVVCVAPSASEKRFTYELSASSGENLIKVKTSAEMISKWTPQGPAKMSLFVPSNLFSTSQVFSLCLVISKERARAN